MSDDRLPVSVCIPVKNEAKNLPDCLAALGEHFAQILVVDSASTDATRDIAAAARAEVLQFEWDGKFPKKRNWVLRNRRLFAPWVLFLDADERVTPTFIAELQRTLPEARHVGFFVSYNNWFMGRILRHGDPMRKLALFRVDAGEYEEFPEDHWSHLDMEVHEHPILQGSIGELSAKIEHRDSRGIEQYLARHNEYSTWEARRFQWLRTADEARWNALTQRQRFKYRHLGSWWFAWLYYATCLVVKCGALDGGAGWHFARLKREYFGHVRLKILESNSRADTRA